MGLSLDKEQNKVKLSLKKVTKKEIPPVQVKILTDVSGSMHHHYDRSSGYMYPLLQRTIALASIIDPDKVVQVIAFDSKAYDLGDFGVDAFDDIWKEFDTNRYWGGTNYAAAFEKVLETRSTKVSKKVKGFFGKLLGKTTTVQEFVEPNEPELNIFLTDGDDGGSEAKFLETIDKVLTEKTYVMCIGAGGSEHYYTRLKRLAEQYENVGFVYFSNTNNLSNDVFYDTILSGKFGNWLEKFSN